MPFWILLLTTALIPGSVEGSHSDQALAHSLTANCRSLRPRALLGLLARPLTLSEMVSELERGCLALDEVRFRPGQDTIISLSPSRFAQVARALGMARGAYRITVPAETSPGGPPDTLQARRRGTRLRDELVHYGASLSRLLDDSAWSIPPWVVKPGEAIPMLVRVPMRAEDPTKEPEAQVLRRDDLELIERRLIDRR